MSDACVDCVHGAAISRTGPANNAFHSSQWPWWIWEKQGDSGIPGWGPVLCSIQLPHSHLRKVCITAPRESNLGTRIACLWIGRSLCRFGSPNTSIDASQENSGKARSTLSCRWQLCCSSVFWVCMHASLQGPGLGSEHGACQMSTLLRMNVVSFVSCSY